MSAPHPRRSKMTPELEKKIMKLTEEGLTQPVIAQRCQCGTIAIKKVQHAHGVKPNYTRRF